MIPVWEDPRVREGLSSQLQERERRLAAGERAIGWKIAFGAPSAQASLELGGSITGFLTDRTLLESGANCAIGAWVKPALEAELAIHLGADVPADADRRAAQAAIRGLGAAIELVDFYAPPTDLAAVIAADIFHRAVLLGDVDDTRRGADASGVAVRALRGEQEVGREQDPVGVVGDLLDTTIHVARLLDAFGVGLKAGEVIIAGSAIPVVALAPGERIRCEFGPLGVLEVELTA